MGVIAVIGGTGLNEYPGLEVREERSVETPFGSPSSPLLLGRVDDTEVVFLPRHGVGHKIPPHLINYRANIDALRQLGARGVIGVAAVGGIARSLPPGGVGVPDDVIDYTFNREHTFSDGTTDLVQHVDFSEPYSLVLRKALLKGAKAAGVGVASKGVMGVTQGPRLESPAEIRRLKRDGCTMVGMTGMPEAALAREAGLEYAALAVSVNWAAGLGSGDIHGEIETYLAQGMGKVQAILSKALPAIAAG